MSSKEFDINLHGIKLQFLFFSKEYIEDTLKSQNIEYEIIKLDSKPRGALKIIAENLKCDKTNHFFSYIRFFEYDKVEYGLVGGKTSYYNPDVFPGKEKENENRYARLILRKIYPKKEPEKRWSNNILIIKGIRSRNNKKIPINDNNGALFMECYLQRRFNLFDS